MLIYRAHADTIWHRMYSYIASI